MKFPTTLTLIVLVFALVLRLITREAILNGYPGLIELECGSVGCRLRIDGRSQ